MFTVYTFYSDNSVDKIIFSDYERAFSDYSLRIMSALFYEKNCLIVLADDEGDWIHTSTGHGECD